MSPISELSDRLQTVFREVLNEPNLILQPTLKMGDIESWDSFAQINLVIAIEQEFDIEFDSEEIGTLLSVKQMIETLIAKSL